MATDIVRNTFGEITKIEPDSQQGAMAQVEQNRAVATVLGVMKMAQMVGRDEPAAYEKIMNACRRPGLAKKATYIYARGGTSITGPSIRLAEAIAQNWGKIRSGFAVIGEDMEHSEIMCFAIDMISLQMAERAITVRHERHTKEGVKRLLDPRDIAELRANMASRNIRECIRAITPSDIWEDALAECSKTQRANVKMDKQSLAELLAWLGDFGVTRVQVEKYIQRKWEAVEPGQVLRLLEIANSIQDGVGAASDYFGPMETADTAGTSPVQKVKDKLKENAEKAQEGAGGAPAQSAVSKPKPAATAKENALQRKQQELYDALVAMSQDSRKEWQDDMESRWGVRNPMKLKLQEAESMLGQINSTCEACREHVLPSDFLTAEASGEPLFCGECRAAIAQDQPEHGEATGSGTPSAAGNDTGTPQANSDTVDSQEANSDTVDSQEDDGDENAEDPWADEGDDYVPVKASDKCTICETPVGPTWAQNCTNAKWAPLCAIHGKERQKRESGK